MCQERSEREIADEILKATEKRYGAIPLVNQVLSERPDLFIPSSNIGKSLFYGKGELDRKTAYIAALAAASALGSDNCIDVQMSQAIAAGATRNEVLEAMMIGSFMTMTASQSHSLRRFREKYGAVPESGHKH